MTRWALSTGDFVRIALFAAILAALGILPPLSFPFLGGVPISIQTLGVMLTGVLIGSRLGALAVLLFIFIVALGAPVLSGQRGGLGVFFGPTVGFLLGWVPGVIVTGWLYRKLPLASVYTRAVAASIIGGIVVIYLFGIPVMAWRVGLSLEQAIVASMVFIPGDLLKAIAVGFVAEAVESRKAAGKR